MPDNTYNSNVKSSLSIKFTAAFDSAGLREKKETVEAIKAEEETIAIVAGIIKLEVKVIASATAATANPISAAPQKC